MVGRRWLVGAGAVVLALMLITASFSLGVYVGEHGWTRQGLQYSPAPAGPLPQANAGPGPGRQPALTGRIRLLTEDGLELATPNGPRQVDLNPQTTFEDETGAPLAPSDLRRGDIVAVFGRLTAGDGGRLLATRVVRLSAPPPAQP
ncbi:MAG: hypothetical protein AB1449_14195 [Chloroflexota bacterium]